MKIKIFSLPASNRKPKLDALEAEVNEWLADHPGVVVEHAHELTQPSATWSHLTLAVWYSEQ